MLLTANVDAHYASFCQLRMLCEFVCVIFSVLFVVQQSLSLAVVTVDVVITLKLIDLIPPTSVLSVM